MEPTAPPPAAPVSPPPAAAKAAAWPDWFGIADLALIVFVGLGTFLLGSFTARNSDVWLHLGIGRLVASGDYSFGKDPLSYSGADRYWVNHSWLYDWASYQLYRVSPSGAALVAAKAGGFVLALALVFGLRRPGRAMWPWAGFGALAALAAAPHLHLRPLVTSAFFLAATLFLLFRVEWKPGSWRKPIALAVLFGIWANVDAWFVLGPVTLLLVLIGEFVQTRVWKERADGATPPLGVPPVGGLAKALAVGTVACMLNPHHVHVWELPAELGIGFPADMVVDSEFQLLTQSPLTTHNYWDDERWGYNWNGFSLVLLLLGGLGVLIAGFGRSRLSHLALWLVFAYLALHQSQLAVFFAVVALPLAAGYLNSLSAGITLKTWADRGTRLVLAGSGVGRLVCLPLAIGMVAFAWPGWLQPPPLPTQKWLTRRAEWRVEADIGFERAVRRLADWRTSGALPSEARGLASSIHFGNLAAWFAPGEKVFVNGRFNFHRPEWPDFLALRKALSPPPASDMTLDATAVRQITERHRSDFLLISPFRRALEDTAFRLSVSDPTRWRVWAVDGRSSVVGRVGALDPAAEGRLAFSPVKDAFGPTVPVLPSVEAKPPADRTWLDDFRTGTKPYPIAADDATILEVQAKIARQMSEDQNYLFGTALAGNGIFFHQPPPIRPLTDAERALAVSHLRAARFAVATNPDSLEGYTSLLTAYQNPAYVELWTETERFHGERLAQRNAAAVRYLTRVPAPEHCTVEQARRAFSLAAQLTQYYLQRNQIDFAQEMMQKAKAYFPAGEAAALHEEVEKAKGQGDAAVKQAEAKRKGMAEGVESQDKRLTDALGEQIGKFDQLAGKANPVQKFELALRAGLPGRAIEAFKADVAGFGANQAEVALVVLEIELNSGRLEQAAADFQALTEGFANLPPAEAESLAAQLRHFEFRKCVIEGNYARAGEVWEQFNGNGRFPKLTDGDRAKLFVFRPEFQPEPAVAALAGVAHTLPYRTSRGDVVSFRAYAQQPAMPAFAALQSESHYHHTHGLLLVIEGRPAEARKHFAAAPAPQGVADFPIPWAELDRQFVRMLDAAAK